MPFKIASAPIPGLGDLVADQLNRLQTDRQAQLNIRLAELASLDSARSQEARYQDAMTQLQRDRFTAEQARLTRPDWRTFSVENGGLVAVDNNNPTAGFQTIRPPSDPTTAPRPLHPINVGNEVILADPFTGEVRSRFSVEPKDATDPVAAADRDFQQAADYFRQLIAVTPRNADHSPVMTPELLDAKTRLESTRAHAANLRAIRTGQSLPPAPPPPISLNSPNTAAPILPPPLGLAPARPSVYTALASLPSAQSASAPTASSPAVWTGGVNNNGALNSPAAPAAPRRADLPSELASDSTVLPASLAPLPTAARPRLTPFNPNQTAAVTELRAAARAGNAKAQAYLRAKNLAW